MQSLIAVRTAPDRQACSGRLGRLGGLGGFLGGRPRPVWLAAAAAAALALLSACSQTRQVHPLEYAPEQTLFVLANAQPMSKQAQQHHERLHGAIKPLLSSVAKLLESELADAAAQPEVPLPESERRLLELTLSATRTAQESGLQGFGIAAQPLVALYEVDFRPVLRVSLGDVARARAFIEQAMAAGQQPVPEHKPTPEASYWVLDFSGQTLADGGSDLRDDLVGQEQEQVEAEAAGTTEAAGLEEASQAVKALDLPERLQLMLGLAGDHLVIALDRADRPLPAAQWLLEKPARSLHAAKTLDEVNQRHGFAAHGLTFWLPSQRLLPLLGVGDAQAVAQRQLLRRPLTPEQAQQAQKIATALPEMVSGITHWDERRKDRRSTLVIGHEDWLQQLRALPGKLPAAAALGSSEAGGLLEMGGSLRLDRFAALITQMVQWLADSPYASELGVDQQATAAVIRMVAPLYAIAPNASGFFARVVHMDVQRWQPGSSNSALAEMALLISSDNPRALMSYASLIDKSLPSTPIQPGQLLPLQQRLESSDQPLWLGMGSHSVGLAIGSRAQSALQALLSQAVQEQGTLLMVRYSGALLGDLLSTVSMREFERYQQLAQERDAEPGNEPTPQQAQDEAEELAMVQEFFKQFGALVGHFLYVEGHVGIGERGIAHTSSYTLTP